MMSLKLQDRTLRLMDKLEKADWFSKVGVEDMDKVTILKNWDAAITSCSTLDWENTTLEASNLVTVQLALYHQDRQYSWNDIAYKVKPYIEPLIDKKVAIINSNHGLPKRFYDCVKWDIIHICILSEYEDICPSAFYQRMAQYYLSGHFPCGWDGPFPYGSDEEFPYSWEGDLPKGRFIIY